MNAAIPNLSFTELLEVARSTVRMVERGFHGDDDGAVYVLSLASCALREATARDVPNAAKKFARLAYEVAAGSRFAAMGENPTRRDGEFYRIFTDGAHRWNLRRVDSREAFLTNKDQIEAWRQDWGDDSDFFRVRVKGEFPSQSLAQFIPADVVAEARKRDVAPINMQDAPILAVDPARFGTDSSCIAIRVGRNARDLGSRQFRGLDTRQLAMEVARLANELRSVYHFPLVHICVDGIGIGAGVVDTLRGMGFDVTDVQAAGRATDYRTYLNTRAELYGRMKDWLQSGGAIEDHEELAEDLTAADYLFTPKGLLQLEAKDSIRVRLGRSPDRADALAMTFAVEPAMMLNSREQIFMDEYLARKRAERDNYDPIGGVADNIRRGLDWEPEAFKARQ